MDDDLEEKVIEDDDGKLHRVKKGSVSEGVFKTYCNKLFHTTIKTSQEKQDREKCETCYPFQEEEEYNPDDRRTEEIDYPRNTDLDKR